MCIVNWWKNTCKAQCNSWHYYEEAHYNVTCIQTLSQSGPKSLRLPDIAIHLALEVHFTELPGTQ